MIELDNHEIRGFEGYVGIPICFSEHVCRTVHLIGVLRESFHTTVIRIRVL